MMHTARKVVFADALNPRLQYTYVCSIGNKCYARQRDTDGSPIFVEQEYMPTLYTPVREEDATHRGFDGTPLMPHMFDKLFEAKEFIEQSKLPVYGDIQAEYMMLSDVYKSEVSFDMARLYVWDIDIEVYRDEVRGYAPVDDPFSPVIAISILWWHLGKSGKVIYGTKDYTPKEGETYIKCNDESQLLVRFLDFLRSNGDYPDIITGWNVQFYDIPYLVNRLKLLFTEDMWERVSPLRRMAARTLTLNGRDQTVIDIKGIAILDYYELYRKFTYSQQESYRLDHIAHVELKKRKVSYKELRTLNKLYELDHQKFIEYNIQDVQLVKELDDKLKLIELVAALAYGAKANFTDTFRQVRLWDIMIYHRLRAEGKQIPPRKDESKDFQYAGAYVKDPLVGLHEWVCSFDVASMYPHIIRQWNLSPETLIGERVKDLTVDELLSQSKDTSILKDKDVCMAANGVLTDRHREGFLPNMLKTLYDERNRHKKLMKTAAKELEHVKEEIRTKGETPELLRKSKELTKTIAAHNNQQLVRKVNLNSAYGALGSAYFRFYNTDMAEAVTITGQLTIRWIAEDVNRLLNRAFKTDEDYIIASDTDSVYVRMGRVVEAFKKVRPNATTTDIVDMLDKFCTKQIEPALEKSFARLADYLNVAIPCLTMKREVIANKGVWTAKKHYILNVFDNEGVRYDKPKLKMMGIETIKSSTPAICRDMLTESIRLFMNGTQEDVWAHVKKSREQFENADFEDIAFPRSVNGLGKYNARDKGVPIHVRGAIAFNDALKRTGLDKVHDAIHEGEKIKFAYLRLPNRFFSHVLSAPSSYPAE